ncbi:MAG: hypothetical protein OXD45_13250 [Rhodobacteraceae bacterium]|nr:hypothetical protein [Paracoccaceae bacterium]
MADLANIDNTDLKRVQCEYCLFWRGDPDPRHKKPPKGSCYRFPPISKQHGRPVVYHNDFCGEWKPLRDSKA